MPDRWPEIVGHSSLVAARFCFRGYNTHLWRGSKVVMQRPAKPCTPVRSRPPPPVFEKSAAALFSFAAPCLYRVISIKFFVSSCVTHVLKLHNARVVKLVDTSDLKSAASRDGACRFDSGLGHQLFRKQHQSLTTNPVPS